MTRLYIRRLPFYLLGVLVLSVSLYIGHKHQKPEHSFSSPEMAPLNRSIINQALYQRIQAVWFADQAPTARAASEASLNRWFKGSKAFDQTCQTGFRSVLETLFPQHYKLPPFESWKVERASAKVLAAPFLPEISVRNPKSPADLEAASSDALSLVLLLDQMPRNIFRVDQSVIYSHFDRFSQSLVHSILSTEPRLDQTPAMLDMPVRRNWFYLPLMHSESMDDHVLLDRLYKEMHQDMRLKGDQEAVAYMDRNLQYESKHVDMLKRFGRYPYRNTTLGRENTREEEEWLKNGGTGFGG